MDSTVQIGLVVLIYTTAILLTLITIFLIKLIYTSTKLAKTLSQTSEMINKELEPTLQELKETLGSINSIAKNADNQINRVKGVFEKFMCVPFRVGQKMRGLFEGLKEGLSAGIRLFRKYLRWLL